jgi:hypothetical protein
VECIKGLIHSYHRSPLPLARLELACHHLSSVDGLKEFVIRLCFVFINSRSPLSWIPRIQAFLMPEGMITALDFLLCSADQRIRFPVSSSPGIGYLILA